MPAEKIELEAIASSNLAALGFNPDKHIAAVQFQSGDIYHYAGVTVDLMQRWYASESRGRFYAKEIRGKFTGQKMTGHCGDCGDLGWVGDRCRDCGCQNYSEDPRKEKAAQTVDELAPIDARD